MWQYLKSLDSRKLHYNFTHDLNNVYKSDFFWMVITHVLNGVVAAKCILLKHCISGVTKWPKLNPLGHISVMAYDEWALFPWKVA